MRSPFSRIRLAAIQTFHDLSRIVVLMTPKAPGKHAHIGMPTGTSENESRESRATDNDRQFASRDKALEFAAALATRNAELMRRLA